MNRRDFITRAVPATTLPFLLNGFAVKAYGRSPIIDALTSAAFSTNRVLVLVQLVGGNDGLNMVVPFNDDCAVARPLRGAIRAPCAQKLHSTTWEWGLCGGSRDA